MGRPLARAGRTLAATFRRHRTLNLAVLLTGTAAVLWTTRGPPPASSTPTGSFAFAALGDAPYNQWEAVQYRLVLGHIDAHDLAFVLHVGDVFWHPCTDAHYRTALARLDGLRHPVIFTPGDNEWTDCWEPGSGSFAPRERLAGLRRFFFADPRRSLGLRRLAVETQADDRRFGEFVEHQRWAHAGVVFATMHIVGSGNGTEAFPGRGSADDEHARHRTGAAAAWLRETVDLAMAAKAAAIVLGFHGPAGLGLPPGHAGRLAYEPFTSALEEGVARFARPVLAVHGDGHEFAVDHPLRVPGVGRLPFTRLQVPGSPDVGWVRVMVTPGAGEPFGFQPIVVPRWKAW